MSWKHENLNRTVQAAFYLLGSQPWENAYNESENLEYRVLRIDDYSQEQLLEIQQALDALTITYTHKAMAPFKQASKSDYTSVLKVFNRSSIDSIVKAANNPETTLLEVSDVIRTTAELTAFQHVFPDVADFLEFQHMLQHEGIKDHEKGGVVLKLNLDNTRIAGFQELLKRSGLDINQINFSYKGGPETVFVPNAAFPENVRPVTIFAELEVDQDDE
jgi:hypothetical protein